MGDGDGRTLNPKPYTQRFKWVGCYISPLRRLALGGRGAGQQQGRVGTELGGRSSSGCRLHVGAPLCSPPHLPPTHVPPPAPRPPQGALMGLSLYGTYELTNMSIISTWTWALTLADIAWGTCCCATASVLQYHLSSTLARTVPGSHA